MAEFEPIIAIEERAAAIFEERDEPDELHEIYGFIGKHYGDIGHLGNTLVGKSIVMHDKVIAVTRRLIRQNASNVYDVQKLFSSYAERYSTGSHTCTGLNDPAKHSLLLKRCGREP